MISRLACGLTVMALACGMLAGCEGAGLGKKEVPFAPSAVPADFAVIVDENHDTYYNREHIQQVVTAQDLMSVTTYTRFRDFNNTVSGSFKQEQPLTDGQIQAMWNEVSRNNLLAGSRLWINWLSDADLYRHNEHTVQIRANGQVRAYNATNGFPPRTRELMLLVDAVRLPIGQKGAPVVGRSGGRTVVPPASEPAFQPPTPPAATLPASSVPKDAAQPVAPGGPALD